MEYEIGDDPQGEADCLEGLRDGGLPEDRCRLSDGLFFQPGERARLKRPANLDSTDASEWRTGWDSNPRWA